MKPVVYHIPHSSTIIPENEQAKFCLSEKQLSQEILVMTDHHTEELFTHNESETIVFPYSRLLCDVERFEEDSQEAMSARGMGAVYTKTHLGSPLRLPLSIEEREEILQQYYHPHHRKLERAVQNRLGSFGRCLILDCHSFSPLPLPHEPDQKLNRPEIDLGTDDYHTPKVLTEFAEQIFLDAGFRVAINSPFSGTLVPLKYYKKNTQVTSLMIEVRRDLYMNPATGEKLPEFPQLKEHLQKLLKKIEKFCEP